VSTIETVSIDLVHKRVRRRGQEIVGILAAGKGRPMRVLMFLLLTWFFS
jgi:hypothetical protein